MQLLSYKQMQDICDCVYLGLSFKESLILNHVGYEQLEEIAKDKRLLNLVQYARTKAKRDLLKRVQDITQGDKTSFSTFHMVKHILASRFGFSENRFELKQKDRQHLDNMRHKKELMRQWAEFQTQKMVNDASHEQLETWAK